MKIANLLKHRGLSFTAIKSFSTLSSHLPQPSDFPPWSYEPRPFFKFEILHESTKSSARVGRIHTPHGIIDTPGYVPVATNGALKGVDFRVLDDWNGGDGNKESGSNKQLVFCNTYHLMRL